MLALYNADCLEKMKDISSNSIDLILCDLPFGCLSPTTIRVDGKKSKHGHGDAFTRGCPWDVKLNLEAFWKEVKRIRKDDHTPCLHFTTTRYGFELHASNPDEFRYDLVWDKNRGVSFLSANKMPMRSHEMIYVFSKKGAFYKRIDIDAPGKRALKDNPEKPRCDGGGVYGNHKTLHRSNGTQAEKACPVSVMNFPGKSVPGKHPTEKPVDLYKFLIERYCPEGGTVLDPTFGSGNSGIAARELNRKYIGIEKDTAFFKKAQEKLGLTNCVEDP